MRNVRAMAAIVAGIGVFACSTLTLAAVPQRQEEETAGNNLSVPAIFVPDDSAAPALRIAAPSVASDPGWDGAPPSNAYPGYWLQKTAATWTADSEFADTANVIADWGDNLTVGRTVAGKPVRVEMSLLAPGATGMTGYVVENLTPQLPDRQATYGTRPANRFVTGGLLPGGQPAPVARVFDTGARLMIEKLAANATWQVVVPEAPMSAEVNAIGAVVYGYNWGTKGPANAPAPGTYRITFFTNYTTIVGIADDDPDVTWDSTATTVVVNITAKGSGGGGNGGGGNGGGGNKP